MNMRTATLALLGAAAVAAPLAAGAAHRAGEANTASTVRVAGVVPAPAKPGGVSFGAPDHVATMGARTARDDAQDYPYTPYQGRFEFVRIHFEDSWGMSGFGRWRGCGREPCWHHDYPSAEYHLSRILQEVTSARPYIGENGGNVLDLDDPRIFQFPILYLCEAGHWEVDQAGAENLRAYLLKGGFIIFDDFDGRDWPNLQSQMRRVLPGLMFQPLDGSEPVWESFFSIHPMTLELPNYRGIRPEFFGIFEGNDRNKRLLAVAGVDGDIGEFWEYSGTGFYPVDLTNEAYKVGVNYVVYGMTH